MRNNQNIPTSLIILAFIFFWPIGIILLILKYSNKNTYEYKISQNLNIKNETILQQNKDFTLLKTKQKSSKIGAIILLIIGVFFSAVAISMIFEGEEQSSIVVGIALAAILVFFGIMKLIKYFKTAKELQKIEIYHNLIIIRNVYEIEDLTSYLKTPKEEILDFVSYMIQKNYLPEVFINKDRIEKRHYIDPNRIFSVECKHCGATNKFITGCENKCEYCNSILNKE